ncbi:TMCO1/EMC3 family protein [Candidatus Woesearchaeota archaeon]|nr:TMCO1/EMC3 family protein [Candidatus Woesearchaeota archaeon]
MAFLDPVLNPLLALQPIFVILIISLFITVVMTFLYKLLTDQKLMKALKDEMKYLQKQVKELRQHPEKMAETQKKMMKKNLEYMKHSMRPTLFTMIPILLVIGWLSSHLAFYPLLPGQEFSVTVTAEGVRNLTIEAGNLTVIQNLTQEPVDNQFKWTLKGDKGLHTLGFSYGNVYTEKEVLITDELKYENPIEKVKNSPIKLIEISNKKLRPLGNFSIFGWQPGWLGIYILISITASIILRKALKIH